MRKLFLALALLLTTFTQAANLTVRDNRVIVSTSSKPAFGASYLVTVYRTGGVATQASSGTSATVSANHGFAVNDTFIVGTDTTKFRKVTVAGTTTLTLSSAVSLAVGDILINLGAETAGSPDYTHSPLSVYQNMDATLTYTNATITASSTGTYRYWAVPVEFWELVRTPGGVPIALYTANLNNIASVRSTTAPANPAYGLLWIKDQGGAAADIPYLYMKKSNDVADWIEQVRAP